MRLAHKVAIVTGGGTGIGEAIAKVFARDGAKVAITGRRKEELERVVKDIERKGGQAVAFPGSVTNEADVQEAVAATVRTFGRLDILVNNAETCSIRLPCMKYLTRYGTRRSISSSRESSALAAQ